MKKLSHRIKGLDEAKWGKNARKCMEEGCGLKFSQNQDLHTRLLATKGRLVEANRHDKYFSCGLALGDPHVAEQSRWEGKNILGAILESLRGNC